MIARLKLGLALPVALLALFLPFIYSLPYSPRDVISSPEATPPLRILPLGDSITWGWQPNFRANGTNGYRLQLLERLTTAGYSVDFVGTQKSGTMQDKDNEGHSGYTILQIHNVQGPGLEFEPNVVLLHAGTNDLLRPDKEEEPWSEAPERLGAVIDDILAAVPDAVVIVAKIIQTEDANSQENIDAFNAAVPDVVQARVVDGHKVTVVDQSIIGLDELIDGVHPNNAGYAHMGDIWFEAVKSAADQGLITEAPQ